MEDDILRVKESDIPDAIFSYKGTAYSINLVELLRAGELCLRLPNGELIPLEGISTFPSERTLFILGACGVRLEEDVYWRYVDPLPFDELLENERLQEKVNDKLLHEHIQDGWKDSIFVEKVYNLYLPDDSGN